MGARGKYATPRPKKPVLSHETANYVTFSRPDLADQFQHAVKPFWLTAGKAKLAKLGLLDEAPRWAEKSERLYLLFTSITWNDPQKSVHVGLSLVVSSRTIGRLQRNRRPLFPPQVDHGRRSPALNNDVVLLQDGLERTYRSKRRLDLKLLVSNFSPGPLGGEFVWEVWAGDRACPGGRHATDRLIKTCRIGGFRSAKDAAFAERRRH